MGSEETRTVDLEEPRLFLHILRDVNLVHLVLKAQFLEGNVDLLPVGRAGCVQFDLGRHFAASFLCPLSSKRESGHSHRARGSPYSKGPFALGLTMASILDDVTVVRDLIVSVENGIGADPAK